MSSKSVILVSVPYITCGPSDWRLAGSFPTEADVTYHLKTAFESYGKVPFYLPKWTTDNGVLDLDLQSIDDCFELAKNDNTDSVAFIFTWNVEPRSSPKMGEILNKIQEYKKQKPVEIICYVLDAWYRGGNYVDFMQAHTDVCDKSITVYEGTIPFLIHKGRKDIADKMQFMPCLPMVLNTSKIDNKTEDFCFIGTMYDHRQTAVNKLKEAFPDKNFFIYTTGRLGNSDDVLRTTKGYIDKMGDSLYSIMTCTRGPHNTEGFEFPSAYPGRLGEAILSMTNTLYFQTTETDRLPKIFDQYEPCIYFSNNDSSEQIKKRIEETSLSDMKQRMKNLYDDLISPEVVIPKILDLNYER